MSIVQIEGPTAPVSVLIVDDGRWRRDALRFALKAPFHVATADTVTAALGVVRHRQLDVVTLDLMMSGLDAIETFTRIREIDSNVQIIVLSGDASDLAHPLRYSASAWIPRPFDIRTLVEAVGRAAEETRSCRLRTAESSASVRREIRAPAPELREERNPDGVRMFSHDIKNRLAAILGFVRVLRADQAVAGHAERALDVIEGNAREAVTLAVNFLHAEESDGGGLRLHKAPAFLNQIVGKVMEDERPRARLKRIALQADLDSSLPLVPLDVAMISRALTNLLNNALHYSPEGGVVSVETCRFGDLMILRIRDHGPGVPADEVPRLFERYGRGAKSASSSSTGLGLYLVRTIVEAHGGSVSATFPPDGGSAFVIFLPLDGTGRGEGGSSATGVDPAPS